MHSCRSWPRWWTQLVLITMALFARNCKGLLIGKTCRGLQQVTCATRTGSMRPLCAVIHKLHKTVKNKPKPQPPVVSSSPELPSDEFFETIKTLRKTNATRKIFQLVEDYAKRDELSIERASFAIKTMKMCDRADFVVAVHQLFWNASSAVSLCDHSPSLTAEYVKTLCRSDEWRAAQELLSRLTDGFTLSTALERHHNALVQLAVGQAVSEQFPFSLSTLQTLTQHRLTIPKEPALRLLKIFLQLASVPHIQQALSLLLSPTYAHSLTGDREAMQLMASHFMSSLDFVKGAVSMETLPSAALPEFVLIGRSNVGKSSLVNALTQRKHLAYTSKTPGKTSEFNFFHATGCVGKHFAQQSGGGGGRGGGGAAAAERERERGGERESAAKQAVPAHKPLEFYLVDVPGVGYAQRAQTTRVSWSALMRRYVTERHSLRCVFHLVDARHGLLPADGECLSLLSVLPPSVQYVVVFTKVDKIPSGAPSQAPQTSHSAESLVGQALVDSVRQAVEFHGGKERVGEVPVLCTSSQSLLGLPELLTHIMRKC